ncbi:ASCH domain-containing protein [Cellulomonas triticagri]|uniref:ASCH domain-containing protein n=1 Tax=Cellulomonas triticagri TaxID=2483352 RepID=A0A3M2JRX1_9CELL|nr:ASCH domain-containing protein [Cellulomonas triticagri]RMI12958.1 ASCH domain-containing protein [Cellulomonas triticagri]
MTDDTAAPLTDDSADALLAFWEVARVRAGVVRVGVVTGPGVSGSMTPPAWSFGDTPEVADALLALVLEGTKTATSAALPEYAAADEPLPVKGDLSIVLDGAGRPGALIRTTAVARVPLGEVGEEHAAAEGEGDRTLATWRTEHEALWRATLGEDVGPDLAVVTERFELLYPRASDR